MNSHLKLNNPFEEIKISNIDEKFKRTKDHLNNLKLSYHKHSHQLR